MKTKKAKINIKRTLNFYLTEEDDANLQAICTKEDVDQTNAIRIALRECILNKDQIRVYRQTLKQQEETIRLLNEILGKLNNK